MHNVSEVLPDTEFQVAAFYCFTPLQEESIVFLLESLNKNALEGQVRGTILLAAEGINGTVCGPVKGVSSLLQKLQEACLENTLDVKLSWTHVQAFRRFKARRKCEIVTMGVAGIDPNNSVGIYVEPLHWNAYLSDPETLVIDTRNEYEIAIGSFKGSVNPYTDTFREFPAWVDDNLNSLVEEKCTKRIAMFCTGGIRCEKATSYLLKEGFKEVHHLHGGILRYLDEVPQEESLWDGECFVFDQRVALNHDLAPGVHHLCHACGRPLAPEDLKSLSFLRGIQCAYCEDLYTDQDRSRFAERQRQIDERSAKHAENSSRPIA